MERHLEMLTCVFPGADGFPIDASSECEATALTAEPPENSVSKRWCGSRKTTSVVARALSRLSWKDNVSELQLIQQQLGQKGKTELFNLTLRQTRTSEASPHVLEDCHMARGIAIVPDTGETFGRRHEPSLVSMGSWRGPARTPPSEWHSNLNDRD